MPSEAPVWLAEQHLLGFLGDIGGLSAGAKADFLRAVALAPPDSIDGLYWRARVTLLRRVEDLEAFDRLFDAWFRDAPKPPVEAVEPPEDDDEEEQVPDRSGGEAEAVEAGEGTGVEASRDDLLSRPDFAPAPASQRRLLAELRRAWPEALPRVRSRRVRAARRGPRLDARRTGRAANRTGGEIVDLAWRRRPQRSRRLLLLVDVSGSMEAHSADLLRVAQAAVVTCPRVEVFTFGTRLTRVTATLRHRDVDTALRDLGEVITDAHGGTRIGAAFEAFLSSSHHLSLARGALVIVASDGLERGDCSAMVAGAERLARLGHRLVWWSPLACHPAYRPVTRGMAGVLGWLDHLGGVRDLATALDEVRALPAVTAARRGSAERRAA
ncbi:MAG TPA: VWA domain-containing protein [Egibacteraceae bacterium]